MKTVVVGEDERGKKLSAARETLKAGQPRKFHFQRRVGRAKGGGMRLQAAAAAVAAVTVARISKQIQQQTLLYFTNQKARGGGC